VPHSKGTTPKLHSKKIAFLKIAYLYS